MEPEDELLLGVVGGPLCQSVVDPDGAVEVLVSSGLAQGSRSDHLLNSILLAFHIQGGRCKKRCGFRNPLFFFFAHVRQSD